MLSMINRLSSVTLALLNMLNIEKLATSLWPLNTIYYKITYSSKDVISNPKESHFI